MTSIIDIAKDTIKLQASSISNLAHYINTDFEKAVHAIHNCNGRLVISGIGKSAIIAQKIVATLNSTGTPSLYMHAADAIHGDLGMITAQDVCLVISKSGNSPEIKILLPLLLNFGNVVIGMVGNMESYLAINSNIVLNTTVSIEACPNNLAPTTSTTAQMVMGDALAVCLMNLNGFTGADFAKFHPGGTLGKKLYLRVHDLIVNNAVPKVTPTTPLPETVLEMTSKLLGAAVVVDEQDNLYGIVTDGDLRRMLNNKQSIVGITAKDICSKNPKSIDSDELAVNALQLMRTFDITHLVVTHNGKYVGVIHLHNLVREGII